MSILDSMISPAQRVKAINLWQKGKYPILCEIDGNKYVPDKEDDCLVCPVCGIKKSYINLQIIIWENYFRRGLWSKDKMIK